MKNTTLYLLGGLVAVAVIGYFMLREKTEGEGEVSSETKNSKIVFTR
jgi:hypothetical protein